MSDVPMVEECGRVVAVNSDSVWVETAARSGCGRCQEAGGCGQNSIFRMLGDRNRRLLVQSGDHHPRVGDVAVVGVPAGALVRASLLAYLFPLIGLLFGASIGHILSDGSEGAAMLGALAGFAGGLGFAHLLGSRMSGGRAMLPVLLSIGRAEVGAGVYEASGQHS